MWVKVNVLLWSWVISQWVYADVPGKPIEVIADTVQQQPVADQVEALGTLRANERVEISASVSEVVTAVHFSDGQRVTAGQLLVELSGDEEQALLSEFKFTVDEAETQLQRIKAVAQKGDASKSLLDEKMRERNVAQARLKAIESRLQDRQIKAPFSGLLGLRNVSVGTYVSPGDILTTLIDDSQLKLDFSVPAVFLNELKPGMAIEASSRVYPGQIFTGEVIALNNQVDTVSRAVTVRAVIPNTSHTLIPGLLLEVRLPTRERQALLIPEEALLPNGSNQFVFVAVDVDGQIKAERRQVRIGSRWPGRVEILSGVAAGEQVVIHGGDKLTDGAFIKIVDKVSVSEFLSDLGPTSASRLKQRLEDTL